MCGLFGFIQNTRNVINDVLGSDTKAAIPFFRNSFQLIRYSLSNSFNK